MKKNKKSIFKEFLEFINKGNALALAVGVIIGGAFNAIVTSINKSIISPLIAALLGDTDLTKSLNTTLKWKEAAIADVEAGLATNVGELIPSVYISWGVFIQAVIDFLLIAIVLFVIVKVTTSVSNRIKKIQEKLKKEKEAEEQAPAPAPAPVEDPADVKLLKEILEVLKENKKE